MSRHFFYILCFLFFACIKIQAQEEYPIVVVIPSYNNAQWYEKNLNSVLNQKYSNYRIVYVNDNSSDETGALLEAYLKEKSVDYQVVHFDPLGKSIVENVEHFGAQVNREKHFFTLVHNTKREGAMTNLYRMIHSCRDEEIIATVDGDDWLADDNVLSLLNRVYHSGEIWLTHGTIKEYPWGHVAWSEAVPPEVIEKNAFREFKCPGHLRTFYAWLFKKIRLEDLLYEGEFFPMTWDMGMMYPMVEMAAERHAFIQDVVYIYNMSNPINDNRVNAQLQNDLDAYIRKKERYTRLPQEQAFKKTETNIASLASALEVDKVVIWGHKLHSHTHSYIHNAFYRTFTHLGVPTYWLDDEEEMSDFDFARTLFITEGQVDKNIPLRADCKYMLHNCTDPKYQALEKKNYIAFQVFTESIFTVPNLVKIDTCMYYDLNGRCLYMPWATDLLPHEIDEVKRAVPQTPLLPQTIWVGTVGDGRFGNIHQLTPFMKASEENGIPCVVKNNLSLTEHTQSVTSSCFAPAIVGAWQLEQGYIPCRIFKNISYGKMGVTNSSHVYELLEKKIVYNPDTYQLFFDAKKKMESMTKEEMYALMDLVKTKHTYVQRIAMLLNFFNLVHETF